MGETFLPTLLVRETGPRYMTMVYKDNTHISQAGPREREILAAWKPNQRASAMLLQWEHSEPGVSENLVLVPALELII